MLGLYVGEQGESILSRHMDIEQQHVPMLGLKTLHNFLGITGLSDAVDVRGVAQQALDGAAQNRMVIGNQDLELRWNHGGPSSWIRRDDRQERKASPRPTWGDLNGMLRAATSLHE